MKHFLLSALLATGTILAVPAMAQHNRDHPRSEHRDNGRDNGRDNDRGNHRSDDYRGNRGHDGRSNNGRHLGQRKRAAWQNYHQYDYNRHDPRYDDYRANRYYRDGSYYQDRLLTNRDRIYRGSDNRYYCRRSDGTTGLIIGAVGGGILGREIAPNGSKTLGAILGGASGALIGRSIDRRGVRCN